MNKSKSAKLYDLITAFGTEKISFLERLKALIFFKQLILKNAIEKQVQVKIIKNSIEIKIFNCSEKY